MSQLIIQRKPHSALLHYILFMFLMAVSSSFFAQAKPQQEFPILPSFTADYQNVDGVNLHYVKGGKGPVVLLVHGFGQTWYEWRYIMPELAKTHTVIAVDLPSLGLSSAPKSYAGQDISELLYKFTKKFSPNSPFDLVAHDIGIWNTYPMVMKYPKDVRRVVYMEAPIPDDGLYQWPAFSPKGESLAWHFSFFAAKKPLAEKLIAGNEMLFLEHFIKVRATNKAVFTPELLQMYSDSWAKPQSLTGSLEYYRALNETAQRNKPLSEKKMVMPVLAIGGGNSMGAYQGDQLKNYALNVQGEVVAGCGHWLPEECPTEINSLVTAFLHSK